MRTDPVLIIAYDLFMFNTLTEFTLAEERRRQMLDAAVQERLAGLVHDRRNRRLRSRAGAWINRAVRGAAR
jgi:hypothetical protein